MTYADTTNLPFDGVMAWRRGRRGDTVRFLRSWMSNPLRTAAIAPSSRALAHLMTKGIDATDPIVELGPGTGVFTRALLQRGVPAHHLTLVESNPEFADLLRTRFANAHVVCADAADVPWQLPHHAELGAVVSGLPLLSMPPDKVSAVLAGAFARLRPDGSFYQFTYSPKCPVRASVLNTVGLKAIRVGRTLQNLPPASVYRFERRSGQRT